VAYGHVSDGSDVAFARTIVTTSWACTEIGAAALGASAIGR